MIGSKSRRRKKLWVYIWATFPLSEEQKLELRACQGRWKFGGDTSSLGGEVEEVLCGSESL